MSALCFLTRSPARVAATASLLFVALVASPVLADDNTEKRVIGRVDFEGADLPLDLERGLHGGMNGHWDLTRGGRTRNTCVNCHDPHTPKFPQVLPVLSPRDRVAVPHTVHAEQRDSHP